MISIYVGICFYLYIYTGGIIAIVWHYWKQNPDYAKSFRQSCADMETKKLWKKLEEITIDPDNPEGRGGILVMFQII